ncbi:hypothetical protein [Persephonella sp.]
MATRKLKKREVKEIVERYIIQISEYKKKFNMERFKEDLKLPQRRSKLLRVIEFALENFDNNQLTPALHDDLRFFGSANENIFLQVLKDNPSLIKGPIRSVLRKNWTSWRKFVRRETSLELEARKKVLEEMRNAKKVG